MVIIHVDDLLIAGCHQSQGFQAMLKKLMSAFDFGKWDVLDEKKHLTYCGGQVFLQSGEIVLSYEQYIKKILPITIPKGRKSESPLTDYEKTKARGLLGAIQWPGAQGVPALLASASIQASEIASNKGESLTNLNKTLRFAKANSEVALRMAKHVEKIDDGILVVFVDAAFGVRTDNASQGVLDCTHPQGHPERQEVQVLSGVLEIVQTTTSGEIITWGRSTGNGCCNGGALLREALHGDVTTSGTISTARTRGVEEEAKRGGDRLPSSI